MMRKLTIFLAAIFALGLIGCSKDAQVNSFLTEWETVTKEISAKIETGDIDGARAAFDAKKDSLKKNWDEIKNARNIQVSEETQKKMEESAKKNTETLLNATTEGAMKMGDDMEKTNKLQALMKEYGEIFQM